MKTYVIEVKSGPGRWDGWQFVCAFNGPDGKQRASDKLARLSNHVIAKCGIRIRETETSLALS